MSIGLLFWVLMILWFFSWVGTRWGGLTGPYLYGTDHAGIEHGIKPSHGVVLADHLSDRFIPKFDRVDLRALYGVSGAFD